jgi:hypothetical protein
MAQEKATTAIVGESLHAFLRFDERLARIGLNNVTSLYIETQADFAPESKRKGRAGARPSQRKKRFA